MAQRSLSDILAAVRFRGDYRNTIRFPDANLNTEIQAAWGELYELIADTNEGYFDIAANIATTNGQPFVVLDTTNGLPVPVWRLRALDRLDGSDFIEMPQIGIAQRNRYTSTNGTPSAYRLTARGADLYPTPNGVYTLRVTYTPIAPSLTDDGGLTLEYYNGWEEYVIYGTLVRLSLNEERTGNDWQQQLGFQRDRIMRGASGRKSQEPDYLPLREGSGDPEFDRDERWR